MESTKPYGIIYLITCLVNLKKYVGQTTNKMKYRWTDHKKCARRGKPYPLYKSIRKYGIENFIIEQIHICNSRDELNEMEKHYILVYDTIIDHGKGYNMNYGGHERVYSEELKKRLSEQRMGANNPFYGHHHTEQFKKDRADTARNRVRSEEERQKLSLAKRGEKHPMYGLRGELSPNYGSKRSMETRQKMRKPKSDETRRKMSISAKRRANTPEGKKHMRKAVELSHESRRSNIKSKQRLQPNGNMV